MLKRKLRKETKKKKDETFIKHDGTCPKCKSVEYYPNYGGTCGKSCVKCGEPYN